MSKRSIAEYEREIQDTSKRIKLNPQYNTTKSRDSKTWFDFLEDTLKINPIAIGRGSDFWENVRQRIKPIDFIESNIEPEYKEKPPEFSMDYRTTRGKVYRQSEYEKYASNIEYFG